MTHLAAGSRRGIPKAWILPPLGVLLILIAVYLDLLSRSIMIDFVAWWPVWAVLVLLAVLARGRRWGRVRLSGLVPVLFVSALAIFVTGHLRGWEAMPSASIQLIGPGAGAASTMALSAHVDGVLEVGSDQSSFLYVVEPVRRGGDVGPPAATEQIQGPSLSVVLVPAADPGLYTFAGWLLDLAEGPTWNLSLGGEVVADLSRLRVSALQVNGTGDVALGNVTESVVVNVSGTFSIAVPSTSPVRVVGPAVVPDDWRETTEGFASPATGSGWVISVGDGSSLTVIEAS
jgi:hypothetical protein